MTVLTLYELAGADTSLRFSPHCWKTRMALAHKGLEARGIPWRFTDKDAISFSGQGLVPVLLHDEKVISDSWQIALHLEAAFPERPSLFGADTAMAVTAFVNSWSDSMLLPAVARLIVLDIYERIDATDRDYFRRSREKRFGQSLEAVVADEAGNARQLDQTLSPLRQVLRKQPFIGGTAPAYADYCVFGMFMWARCISPRKLLDHQDPIHAWRDSLLDAFDGLARRAPAINRLPR